MTDVSINDNERPSVFTTISESPWLSQRCLMLQTIVHHIRARQQNVIGPAREGQETKYNTLAVYSACATAANLYDQFDVVGARS